MFKNKYPLKLFSIISLALVLLTVIFVSIFGVNSSIEIAGGSQIEIRLSTTETDGRENTTEYVDVVKDVLKEHNCSIDSYFVEDKLVDTYLIVRIAKTEIKNADRIPAKIAGELQIDETRVSQVQTLSSYFTNNQMLFIGLAVLSLIIICFFAGWLRYSIIGGITLAFATLHSIILSLATIFLFRVQFSIASLVCVLAFAVLSIFAIVHILERAKENAKSKQYANLTEEESLINATKQNKGLLWILAVVLVLSLVLVCVPIRYVQLAAVSLQLCVVACAYTSLCVAPALHAYLMEIRNTKEKQKLSKNVTTLKK